MSVEPGTLLGLAGATIGVISGIVGTLTDNRDKKRRLTWGGYVAIVGIVLGAVVGQVNDQEKRAADLRSATDAKNAAAELNQNTTAALAAIKYNNNLTAKSLRLLNETLSHTDANLAETRKGAISSSQSLAAAKQAAEVASRGAKASLANLGKTDSAIGTAQQALRVTQSDAKIAATNLLDTWRLARPFGTWYANISLEIPLMGGDAQGVYGPWIERVMRDAESRSPRSYEIPISGNLVPGETESREAWNLFGPDTEVAFSRSANRLHFGWGTTGADLRMAVTHVNVDDARILLLRSDRKPSLLSVKYSGGLQIMNTDGAITNWVDLYGGDVGVALDTWVPEGTTTVRVGVGYYDTIAPHQLDLVCSPLAGPLTNRRQRLACIWRKLGVVELGHFPQDYPGPVRNHSSKR
jgi:hypothetical protein